MSGVLVVIGAVNVDLVVRGVTLPAPGVTVTGGVFERHDGGKGGNQAVAAARALRGGPAEGRVRLLGAVGDDALGADALEALLGEGVDVGHVLSRPGVPTGVALIVVDDAGENQIAVAPGANATLEPSEVEAALDDLGAESVVLGSLEVPLESVRRAAEIARAAGATFVLNPAPAAEAATGLLGTVDILTPNEHELRRLSAGPGPIGAAHPGLRLLTTLGEQGAVLSDGDHEVTLPAPLVDAVDTTGAGDCLNGVLAAALLEGRPLEEAARRAVRAASMSVGRPGARGGMPTREEVDRGADPA